MYAGTLDAMGSISRRAERELSLTEPRTPSMAARRQSRGAEDPSATPPASARGTGATRSA